MIQKTPNRHSTRLCPAAAVLYLALAIPPSADASELTVAGEFHPDRHGGLIYFPLGELSFADQVVSYSTGDEVPQEKHRVASRAVGPPNASSVSFGWTGQKTTP